MLTQKQINTQERQGYYAILPQIRSAVKPAAFTDVYSFPQRRLGYRGLWIGMLLIFASLFLALDFGYLNFLSVLFQ